MAANSSPVPLGLAHIEVFCKLEPCAPRSCSYEQDRGAQGSSLQPHCSSVDAFTLRSDPDAPRSAFLTMTPRATTSEMVGINVHG